MERLWEAEAECGADSWADGERSRRGPAGLALSGAMGDADAGRLRGGGGLAEPERVRVDMADFSCGMDDLALLNDGAGDSDREVEAVSDMVRGDRGGRRRRAGGEGGKGGG